MKKLLLIFSILLANNSFSKDVIIANKEDLKKREFEFIKQTTNEAGKIVFKSCYIESTGDRVDSTVTECPYFIGDEDGYSKNIINKALISYNRKAKTEYATDAILFGVVYAINFAQYKKALAKNSKRHGPLNDKQIKWLRTHELNTPSVIYGGMALGAKSFIIDDAGEYVDILESIETANKNDVLIAPVEDQSIKSIKNRLTRALYEVD